MTLPDSPPCRATARDLLFFTTPALWPTWPYLALVRRYPDGRMDYGVLYDARGVSGRTGYSATVFLANLFELPEQEEELLRLPKEVFDTPDEMAAAGWVVD